MMKYLHSRFITCIILTIVIFIRTAVASESSLSDLENWSKVVFKPYKEAVLTSKVNSSITAFNRDFGESFEKGDILFEFDSVVYEAAFKQVQASLVAAKSTLSYEQKMADKKLRLKKTEAVVNAAKANLNAVESMMKDNNASKVEMENAKRDYDIALIEKEEISAAVEPRILAAEREVAVAEANFSIAEKELSECKAAAPFAGRVVERKANEHEQVRKGDPLVYIIADRILIASFLLPEELFHKVKANQEVTVEVDLQKNTKIRARIVQFSAAVDPGSRTFEVRAEVDNRESRLRSGMGGRISLQQFMSGK
ncbi:MAG: efflux RND transporter periplasmic adaptor subunit [Planctomycetota bacterium]|jgi:multidrug resistance efflux pump